MKPKASRLLAASQIVLCLTALPVIAADHTWDGTDNLFDTAHWNPGTITWPGINNNAIIDSGKVTVNGTWDVDAVTVSGGTLDVITDGLFNRAFNLTVANSTNNAVVTVNGGTVSRNFIEVGRGTGAG
ncbi:MAG: hypothetical protein KDN05_04720, partial [Verrucomicrobiae bacterium]|nr:hypothetical protein [Verrucomicrobiae bacterium]